MACCENPWPEETSEEFVQRAQRPRGMMIIAVCSQTYPSAIGGLLNCQAFCTSFHLSLPVCVSLAYVLAALPEPNFILVGFSKAGFAQVVCFLKYLFCRPFTHLGKAIFTVSKEQG